MPADTISSTAPRSSPVHGDPGSRPTPSRPLAEPGLLDEAAAGPLDRVLIIGAPGPDLLCDALRRGCRAALETVTPPAHPEPADVVVAPRVAGEAKAAAIALCARRALGTGRSGGRLALSLPGHGARALARFLARLRACGFERIRLHPRSEGGMLLMCLLPGAGPVSARARAADRSGGRRA